MGGDSNDNIKKDFSLKQNYSKKFPGRKLLAVLHTSAHKAVQGIQAVLNGAKGQQGLSEAIIGDPGFHDAKSFLQGLLEH